jgi:lysyl-tRNA synthetase class 2
MLEWYRVGWELAQLIDETVALIREAAAIVRFVPDAHITTYRQLFIDSLGIDPFTASLQLLQAPLADVRIEADGLQRDDWLDLLITHRIQPAFAAGRITVVHDWPASQCALARIRASDPKVAERFELFLGPVELANGYHELNDPCEQRSRFENDNRRRLARGLRELPLDENLLDALGLMPDCVGVAIGIDRLLMAMLRTDDVRPLLAFDFARA